MTWHEVVNTASRESEGTEHAAGSVYTVTSRSIVVLERPADQREQELALRNEAASEADNHPAAAEKKETDA